MNKKLLSLVIAGVLAVTSVPALNVSAATKVESTMRGKTYVGRGTLYAGATLYSYPAPGNRLNVVVSEDTDVKVYRNNRAPEGGHWYYIRYNGSYYYVYDDDIELDD